jgi:cytoskeletal protein RodZ
MALLSEKLRRERELRGISLKQISDDTRIGVRFLEALEENRFELIPGEFYRRSYLRAYTRYLGLDEDRAVNAYISSQKEKPTSETSPDGNEIAFFSYRAGNRDIWVISAESLDGRSPAIPFWLPWVGLGAVVLMGTLWVVSSEPAPAVKEIGETRPEAFDKPATASVSPSETVSSSASRVPVLSPPVHASPVPRSLRADTTGKLRLVLDVGESCWLEIMADGKVVTTGLKERGYRREFVANEELRLWLGNAGGVSLWINDRLLKPLGRPGQVRKDLSITPDNYTEYVGDNVS